MGFLNDVLDKMGLNDPLDDYDDDIYDDYDDDTSSSYRNDRKSVKDYDDSKSRKFSSAPRTEKVEASYEPKKASYARSNPKVTPINKGQKKGNFGNTNLIAMKPIDVDGSKDVTNALRDGVGVILILEGLDISKAQRIMDCCCGACYALDGAVRKISEYIFLIAPRNLVASGDFQELESGNINVNDFTSEY